MDLLRAYLPALRLAIFHRLSPLSSWQQRGQGRLWRSKLTGLYGRRRGLGSQLMSRGHDGRQGHQASCLSHGRVFPNPGVPCLALSVGLPSFRGCAGGALVEGENTADFGVIELLEALVPFADRGELRGSLHHNHLGGLRP